MPLSVFEFAASYNKIESDIAEEFYLPCLSNCQSYDRISGYFGSTIYVIAWKALRTFIANNGTMRILCSPVISQEDWDAIDEGSRAQKDALLAKSLSNDLNEMLADENLVLPVRLLACLVANGTVEIKVGIVKSNGEASVRRLFHDKMGVFIDEEGNAVGFRGSFNETYKGLANDGNIESIDVFQSWDGGKDAQRANDALRLFEKIWAGHASDTVEILDIPSDFANNLRKQASQTDVDQLLDEIKIKETLAEKWMPSNKGRKPRQHQIRALESWIANEHRGILKHATGSGKTFTAICAINYALKAGKTVIILVPSKELLYHWRFEVKASIPQKNIKMLLCGDGNNTWRESTMLDSWTAPSLDTHKVIIAMMQTAASDNFMTHVTSGEHLFMVADEVHRLGSAHRLKILDIDAGWRLGLSATPERYGDVDGTRALIQYFNGLLQPEFTLEDAIKAHALTRYFYHPQHSYLSDDEQEDWNNITEQISTIIARAGQRKGNITDLMKKNQRLKYLLIKRAGITKKAKSKVDLARKVLTENYQPGQKWIVYCDDVQQLNLIYTALSNDGLNAYVYYAEMAGDRAETLKYFEAMGGILVSIKCLDEGVDIPSTSHALILASSKNPREFIQRRGRVLRLSENKHFAHIYDAIVLPRRSIFEKGDERIVFNELARAVQFGKWAENPSCITDLKLISIDYGIDYSDCLEGGFEDE